MQLAQIFHPPFCAIVWTLAFPSQTLTKLFPAELGFFGLKHVYSLASDQKFSNLSVVFNIFPKTSEKMVSPTGVVGHFLPHLSHVPEWLPAGEITNIEKATRTIQQI